MPHHMVLLRGDSIHHVLYNHLCEAYNNPDDDDTGEYSFFSSAYDFKMSITVAIAVLSAAEKQPNQTEVSQMLYSKTLESLKTLRNKRYDSKGGHVKDEESKAALRMAHRVTAATNHFNCFRSARTVAMSDGTLTFQAIEVALRNFYSTFVWWGPESR